MKERYLVMNPITENPFGENSELFFTQWEQHKTLYLQLLKSKQFQALEIIKEGKSRCMVSLNVHSDQVVYPYQVTQISLKDNLPFSHHTSASVEDIADELVDYDACQIKILEMEEPHAL